MNRFSVFIHSKVARRIFFLFVVCALLPVCVLSIISIQNVSSRLKQDGHERLHQVSKNAGMAIMENLALLQNELENLSLSGKSKLESTNRMQLGVEGVRRFKTVSVVSKTGIIHFQNSVSSLYPEMLFHLKSGKALVLIGYRQDEVVLKMVTKIAGDRKDADYIVGEINPEYLWGVVRMALPYGIDLAVADSAGHLMYASFTDSPELVQAVKLQSLNNLTGQLEWQSGSSDYYVHYWTALMKPAFLADSWVVVAVQSKQELLQPVSTFVTSFQLVVAMTILVVVLVSSFLIRKNLEPLSILMQGTARLGGGDFSSRVEISSGDEFEALSLSFNSMSEQLGMQFSRQQAMSELVQRVLEAHNQEGIVKAIMAGFRKTLTCNLLAVAISDSRLSNMYQVYYGTNSDLDQYEFRNFQTGLNIIDICRLKNVSGHLHLKNNSRFFELLEPITAVWSGDVYLLPIVVKESLLGALILGYSANDCLVEEELAYTRKLSNEMAISLDNVRLIGELNVLNRGTIEALANAVDAKSPWTSGHSDRVTKLALEIGKDMGFDRDELGLLQLGGIFHDIGKIGIPEQILDKPSRLTEEEYAIIMQHPEKGAAILKPIQAYHAIIPIVAQHHERFDGHGYPLGLAGKEIVIGARILAVADVFDAMISSRPYRSGWDIDKVLKFIRENSGSHFDPEIVEVLLKIDLALFLELPVNAALDAVREV